jgi:transposase
MSKRGRKPLSQEKRDLILELAKSKTFTVWQIAQRLGLSESTVVRYMPAELRITRPTGSAFKRLGRDMAHGRSPWPNDEDHNP